MNNALPFSVGWELEFALRDPSELRTISNAMVRAGIDNENYGRWRRSPVSADRWDLKTDSSCGIAPGVPGFEAVSPVIYNYTDLTRHATVAPLIRRNGAIVNERCGLHVHIGLHNHPNFSSAAVDRLVRFLNRYEAAFYMLVPLARRNNPYCKPMPQSVVDRVRRAHGNVDIGHVWADKNTWVNFQTMGRIGTVEFRLFPGTLDKDEIVGTVMFLQQVLDCVICAGKEVQWGKAHAKDSRMMFYTMLQQAGFYGSFDPDRLKIARKWATSHFGKENRGTDPVVPVHAPAVDDVHDATLGAVNAFATHGTRTGRLRPRRQGTATTPVQAVPADPVTSTNVTPVWVTPVWADATTEGSIHEVTFTTEQLDATTNENGQENSSR